MNRTTNKVILVGKVGRDPEFRNASSPEGEGEPLAYASLATGRDGENRKDWHRLAFRGRLANFAREYVAQGDRIYVEGALRYGSYDRDGVTVPTVEVEVRECVLLSSPEREAAS